MAKEKPNWIKPKKYNLPGIEGNNFDSVASGAMDHLTRLMQEDEERSPEAFWKNHARLFSALSARCEAVFSK